MNFIYLMLYKLNLMCYNSVMSKEFKKCPRCNSKVHVDFGRCGNCGLNFIKFNSATAEEAKSAFRMGEKERVLYTKQVPSDINRLSFFITCLLGGWFGLHYFKLGKLWRGLFQLIGFGLGILYSYFTVKYNIRFGYLANLLLVGGIIWASSVIIWMMDTVRIVFKRFKYPVSLPYSDQTVKTDK